MAQDFRTIHETGILQGIMDYMSSSNSDWLRSIGDRIFGNNLKDPNTIRIDKNIAKSARALTATFPVLVTEATELETAVMVSKAIERKAVALLQMLFAANQITSVTGAKDYLNRFHHNMDFNIDISDMGVDDIIDYSNKHIHESTNPIEEMEILEAIKWINEDTKNNIHHVLSSELNEVSINDYSVTKNYMNEAEVWRQEKSSGSKEYGWSGDDPDASWSTYKVTVKDNEPMKQDELKQAYEVINKSVLKTDIQKANEAVPSLIVVNFVSIVDGLKVVNTAVIGVKAVLHYVSSEEMVNRVILKNEDRRGLLNFIRATTREISFFKDFLFAVKRAKIDAVSKSGKGSNSKIWKILELRADKSKLNRAAGRANVDCAAITSLIITKEEVELIKKSHRIDLTKPGTLVAIMRGYNFMCCAIVDTAIEKVDFMWDDGEKDFETLSFMSLERDDSNGQLKKIINVMATRGR